MNPEASCSRGGVGVLRQRYGLNAAGCAITSLLLMLAGCTPSPPPRLISEGHLPGSGASFMIAPSPAEGTAILAQCLIRAGLVRRDKPTYYVQILHSRHPGNVMIHAGHEPLPSALPPSSAPPARPWPARATVETLSLSINTMAGGREVYRARIERIIPSIHGRHHPTTALSDLLCQEAILPAGTSQGGVHKEAPK